MTSRERILAAIDGTGSDRVPLAAWCFGVSPPAALRWEEAGVERRHWYSLRLEHIHTLLQPWTLEDDFRRVLAWRSLGVDDVLEVSVPWSQDPAVTWRDSQEAVGGQAVLVREYDTPAGRLRHAVKRTGEESAPGWVVQPDHVPLFEDMNIPRAVEQAVSSPEEISRVPYLYAPPDQGGREWFAERMGRVGEFAAKQGVAVQAWSAFGMDAAVWLMGAEGAILLALEEPEVFAALLETIAATDLARTELAAATPGVDIVVQRGWYSSTDFWSPRLFDQFVYPHVRKLAAAAHRHGARLAYVMTTGVETLGPRLAEAGVDLLYFVDPVQDTITVDRARELLGGRMALAGGVNALTLAATPDKIRAEVRRALEALAPTGRFLLQPVDALFPDTPWEGVEAMIEAWREWG